MSPEEKVLFGVFGAIVAGYLVLDLGFFHKKAGVVKTQSAFIETFIWVIVSIAFGFLIRFYVGTPQSYEFFTAYITEYALSVDNIFVILLILRYFRVNEAYYHHILFFGILGAIVFRAIFIFLGAFVIHKFHFILYIFGAFLLFTGIKMLFVKDVDDETQEFNPEDSFVLRIAKKYLRFTSEDRGDHFWVRDDSGKLVFTTLFMCLILIETTDLIFAVDSIPAVFGVSDNEFVVYTSNMFAVMGLRSMFFVLSSIIDKFYLLKKGLAIVLAFIGSKMLMDIFYIKVDEKLSLIVIVSTLAFSVILSILIPQTSNEKKTEQSSLDS
jgi:tellurite resistance protein TerC